MDLLEEITCYVDGELKDENNCCRIQQLIADDCMMRNEYLVQKCIKDLLGKRFSSSQIPSGLREKILLHISSNSNN